MDAILEYIGRESRLVGISGCQGIGKTTLTRQLTAVLNSRGIPTVGLSIDDFYKTDAELFPETRGLFGTHDVPLCLQVLESLLSGSRTECPVYDKSLHNGRGDRSKTTMIASNVSMVILEGWFLGFGPTQSANREFIDKLAPYEAIFTLVDKWILLKPPSINMILQWRIEQEHSLIASTGSGMSDIQVSEFVAKFMPVYVTFEFDRSEFLELQFDNRRRLVQANKIP
jgi:D-glycerate 3-kinase